MGQHDSTGRFRRTRTAYRRIDFHRFILAAGTDLAAFADGASPTPGLAVDDSESMGVRWNNHATPAAILGSFDLPEDRVPDTDAKLRLKASKTGATVGDAVTFAISAFANPVGALRDADSSFGGTSSAMDGDATSKTVQEVTLDLAAADIPNSSSSDPCPTITLSIKPTDGTLGTDDVTLNSVLLEYTAWDLSE